MPSQRLRLPLALGLLIFCVFSLTSSTHPYGYEGWTISHVEKTLFGTGFGLKEPGVAGVLDRLAYAPFAVAKHALAPGRGESLRRIAYVFVQPLVATLACLALYGLALEVHGRPGTAAGLALVAAFTTMLWPYAKFGLENHQTLWTVASAWLLLRYALRPSPGRAALAAAALGMLALTKLSGVAHAALLLAAGAALALRRGAAGRPAFRRELAVGLAIGGAALATLLVSNRLIHGGWLLAGRYEVGTEYSPRLWWNSALGLLVGPGKSLFVFNPTLLLGAALLPRSCGDPRSCAPSPERCSPSRSSTSSASTGSSRRAGGRAARTISCRSWCSRWDSGPTSGGRSGAASDCSPADWWPWAWASRRWPSASATPPIPGRCAATAPTRWKGSPGTRT